MIRTFDVTPPADNLVAWQLEYMKDDEWIVVCAGPLSRSITGALPDDAELARIRWGVKGGGPLLDGDVLQLRGAAEEPARALTLLITTNPPQPQVNSAFTLAVRALDQETGPADDLVMIVDWQGNPIPMTPTGGAQYKAVLIASEAGRYTPEVRCENPQTRSSITFDVLP